MDAMVVYHSKTGHSRKLALRAAQALAIQPVDIRDWKNPGRPVLVFIVSGVYGGKTAPEVLDFARSLAGSPVRAALITSCASGREEQEDLRAALKAAGVSLLMERFTCPGSFLFFRLGRPNRADCEAAAEFAARTAALYLTPQAG